MPGGTAPDERETQTMTTFTPLITADQAAADLRAMLADTATVYVIQRRVSASGMNRKLSLLVLDTSDGVPELVDVTVKAAAVLGDNVHDADGRHALSVNGAGMDMHFHTVYRLSSKLYADDATPRPEVEHVLGDHEAGYVLTRRTL